jgi:DNA-binding MarR family transcriptional regulator
MREVPWVVLLSRMYTPPPSPPLLQKLIEGLLALPEKELKAHLKKLRKEGLIAQA